MSKIKFNFDMSGKDKEEEAFKKQMAQLYAFQAMAQGQNPMEAYRGVMDYKPTPPPAEAIQSADPAQQMQNFTQRSGQPPQGLPPRQIDPMASQISPQGGASRVLPQGVPPRIAQQAMQNFTSGGGMPIGEDRTTYGAGNVPQGFPDPVRAMQQFQAGQQPATSEDVLAGNLSAPPTGTRVESYTGGGLTIKNEDLSDEERAIWKTWATEVAKNKATNIENYKTVKALMQPVMSFWKAAAQEKADKGIPKGLASKIASGAADMLELEGFPASKAFMGVQIETAMNLSKLISGGSRIVRDVFNKLLKTLASDTGISRDAFAKLSQTMKSSFARANGREATPEELALLDKDILAMWNSTEAAQIPSEEELSGVINKTYSFKLPDGRIIDVTADKIPQLMKDFEELEVMEND